MYSLPVPDVTGKQWKKTKKNNQLSSKAFHKIQILSLKSYTVYTTEQQILEHLHQRSCDHSLPKNLLLCHWDMLERSLHRHLCWFHHHHQLLVCSVTHNHQVTQQQKGIYTGNVFSLFLKTLYTTFHEKIGDRRREWLEGLYKGQQSHIHAIQICKKKTTKKTTGTCELIPLREHVAWILLSHVLSLASRSASPQHHRWTACDLLGTQNKHLCCHPHSNSSTQNHSLTSNNRYRLGSVSKKVAALNWQRVDIKGSCRWRPACARCFWRLWGIVLYCERDTALKERPRQATCLLYEACLPSEILDEHLRVVSSVALLLTGTPGHSTSCATHLMGSERAPSCILSSLHMRLTSAPPTWLDNDCDRHLPEFTNEFTSLAATLLRVDGEYSEESGRKRRGLSWYME